MYLDFLPQINLAKCQDCIIDLQRTLAKREEGSDDISVLLTGK